MRLELKSQKNVKAHGQHMRLELKSHEEVISSWETHVTRTKN